MGKIISTKVVEYRKGYIEVSNVHEHCVNVEVWALHPDAEMAFDDFGRPSLEDGTVTGNVELELDEAAIAALIAALQAALETARGGSV